MEPDAKKGLYILLGIFMYLCIGSAVLGYLRERIGLQPLPAAVAVLVWPMIASYATGDAFHETQQESSSD